MTAADLPATRREALLDMADRIDRGPSFPLSPSILSTLVRERAERYPAAEEHIDLVPHDPDLPRDLGAVERGACGAVMPPRGDICQMQPGHRDHVRTQSLFLRLTEKQEEADQLQGEVERLRGLVGEALDLALRYMKPVPLSEPGFQRLTPPSPAEEQAWREGVDEISRLREAGGLT